jgi:hypothetical protein
MVNKYYIALREDALRLFKVIRIYFNYPYLVNVI